MVKKYKTALENREINSKTGNVWAIQNVPPTWRTATESVVIADGYYFAEDGTAYKGVPNDAEE